MNSFETRPTDTHVPSRRGEPVPPDAREKLWAAGAVALVVAVGTLVRRRYVWN